MISEGRLDVFTTGNAAAWRAVLDEIGAYDFFHLPEFHRLAEIRGEGEAILLAYRESGCTIALPLLLRDIDLPSGGAAAGSLRDATSVRGMAGPVASPGEISREVVRRFQSGLQQFLEENHVLTVYSRLNPVLDQAHLLDGYGITVDVGVTVAIDLTLPPEEQVARYHRKRRQQIAKLRKSGFICVESGMDRLEDLLRVYYQTMDRLGADPAYYFERSYFEYLLTEMSGVMRIFACTLDGVIVSFSLCAECAGIIEMHLAGTASEYLPMSPSKLVYDKARQWGNQIGARVLHMGGSIGGKRDSLHKLKMEFGGIECAYRTWRHVVDQGLYHDICRRVGVRPDCSYFPAYRDPALIIGGPTEAKAVSPASRPSTTGG